MDFPAETGRVAQVCANLKQMGGPLPDESSSTFIDHGAMCSLARRGMSSSCKFGQFGFLFHLCISVPGLGGKACGIADGAWSRSVDVLTMQQKVLAREGIKPVLDLDQTHRKQ